MFYFYTMYTSAADDAFFEEQKTILKQWHYEDLPNDSEVQILIYDIKGSMIDELVNDWMEAGYHQFKWNGDYHSSGIYFIQMIADNGKYRKTMKMSLIK